MGARPAGGGPRRGGGLGPRSRPRPRRRCSYTILRRARRRHPRPRLRAELRAWSCSSSVDRQRRGRDVRRAVADADPARGAERPARARGRRVGGRDRAWRRSASSRSARSPRSWASAASTFAAHGETNRRVAIVGGIISSSPAFGLGHGVGRAHPHAVHQLGVVVRALLVVRARRRGRSGCRSGGVTRRSASPSGRCSGSPPRSSTRSSRRHSSSIDSSPPWTATRSDSSMTSGPPSRASGEQHAGLLEALPHGGHPEGQTALVDAQPGRGGGIVEAVAVGLELGGMVDVVDPARRGTRTCRRRTRRWPPAAARTPRRRTARRRAQDHGGGRAGWDDGRGGSGGHATAEPTERLRRTAAVGARRRRSPRHDDRSSTMATVRQLSLSHVMTRLWKLLDGVGRGAPTPRSRRRPRSSRGGRGPRAARTRRPAAGRAASPSAAPAAGRGWRRRARRSGP